MEWWQIVLISFLTLVVLIIMSSIFYKQFFKRFYDFVLSFVAIIVFSPLLVLLAVTGLIAMKGNPFFLQERPGKKMKNGKEKIFKLIKFRTMTNEKNENGEFLPDEQRLKKYGKFLRATSLDELPELINILVGDMSIIGPRPLLVRYLTRYSEEQSHRHDVRPGLTGYAQVHGRNALSWDEKFKMDVWYTTHISLFGDIKILFETILVVICHKGISSETSATMEEFNGNEGN